MRLITFDLPTPLGAARRVGCVGDGRVVDVNLAYRRFLEEAHGVARAGEVADAVVPTDMLAFVENGSVAIDALELAVAHASAGDGADESRGRLVWSFDVIAVRAPLPAPRSLREFGQFVGHATQGGRRELSPEWYEAPHYWKGNPSTIIGPEETIRWPEGVERLDFELEIACVIGRAGLDVDESTAMEHVYGFALFNDVCARDLQSRELPAGKGPSKSHDFCSAMGPMLVTTDELDLGGLTGTVCVNGEEWARATTDDMHFSWPQVVAYASRVDGIVPGDVLVSGTLTGCSAIEHYGWPASGPLLRPGDLIELELDGLGVLRNRVEARSEAVLGDDREPSSEGGGSG
jgi:2-keto-4-pentenoate hydratase/2-oxohepta-3-ene-1,7-dioic acid hydratase in catechol pathway